MQIQLGSLSQPNIPGSECGIASINQNTGNLSIRLFTAAGTPFDVLPKLTYNSRGSASSNQFGFGWSDVYNPTVTQIDSVMTRHSSLGRQHGAPLGHEAVAQSVTPGPNGTNEPSSSRQIDSITSLVHDPSLPQQAPRTQSTPGSPHPAPSPR